MRIGIELNHVIRDINSQMLKYYVKDFDKKFDSSNIDMSNTNFIDSLGFKTKKAKNNFMYIDYPYEIFGCAKTVGRHTSLLLNEWLDTLDNNGLNGEDVSLFSLKETALTIQSSFYFLSKIGCRVRNIFFPKDGKSVWDKYDVVITTDERIVKSKPNNKSVVLIETSDNKHLSEKCDLTYESFEEIISDEAFIPFLKMENNNTSLFGELVSKVKKVFKR